MEEIGTPIQHVTCASFVFIPYENIEASKDELKDYIFVQFHGHSPEMGQLIGVVTLSGPYQDLGFCAQDWP